MASKVIPPWHEDSSPEAWVKLTVAAIVYFKKHPTYLRRLAAQGHLPGAVRYGSHWWVRLPDEFTARLAKRNFAQQADTK